MYFLEIYNIFIFIKVCVFKIIYRKNRLEVLRLRVTQYLGSLGNPKNCLCDIKDWLPEILSFVWYILNIILLSLTENFLFLIIFNQHTSVIYAWFVAVFDSQVSPISTLIGTIDKQDLTFWHHRLLVSERYQSLRITQLCGSLWKLDVFSKSTFLVRLVNSISAS